MSSFLEGLGTIISVMEDASANYYTYKKEIEEKRKNLIEEIEKFNREAEAFSVNKICINNLNENTKSVSNDNTTIINGYKFTSDAYKFLINNGYTQAGDNKHYMKGNKMAIIKIDYSKDYPVCIEVSEINI